MGDRQMSGSDFERLEEAMQAFRYFPLEGRQESGDRFLQPWLFCHVYAMGSRSKGERKRASKELKRFFKEGQLKAILDQAGQDRALLLEAHLFDSAAKYLAICRDDDGFGRKFFGLTRMKADEKEDKIINDVYRAMIPLLAALVDMTEGPAMMRALDQACRQQYPLRVGDIRYLVETAKDESLLSVLPPFEDPPQADHGFDSEP